LGTRGEISTFGAELTASKVIAASVGVIFCQAVADGA
jgi:hypothetical protein